MRVLVGLLRFQIVFTLISDGLITFQLDSSCFECDFFAIEITFNLLFESIDILFDFNWISISTYDILPLIVGSYDKYLPPLPNIKYGSEYIRKRGCSIGGNEYVCIYMHLYILAPPPFISLTYLTHPDSIFVYSYVYIYMCIYI